MTKQETILQKCIDWMEAVAKLCSIYDTDEKECAEYIIECIKKQVPKKPIMDGVQDKWTGCLLFYGVQCPNCHNMINKYNGDYARELVDYCEHCGQAILWEGNSND